MNATELYDEVAISFPALWPQRPEWVWVNVHDGHEARLKVISELVDRAVASADVIVVVHSDPGTAVRIPKESAARYIAQFVLKYEIQASDVELSRFVSVSRSGVATIDA